MENPYNDLRGASFFERELYSSDLYFLKERLSATITQIITKKIYFKLEPPGKF